MDQNRTIKRVFSFVLYGCVGITTEIFFTAIVDLINAGNFHDLRLKGQSYIWMFPIYGAISIFFPIGYERLKRFVWPLRALAYALVILAVEYLTGFLLDVLTGSCPWEYQTGWHIHGYIRLDYTPLWMGFALMIEQFHRLNIRLGLTE